MVKKDEKEFILKGERDVMDTWATSSLTPQISSKAINDQYSLDSNRHNKLFPADLRPQAHEIIRSWAFYTICKAHLHQNTIPWKDLMISGWCLAKDKTKMSKSKGNVVTPVNLIKEKGSDIVRYWAGTSQLGADTAYSEDVLLIGKKLINKLWNASKFAAIHLGKVKNPDLVKDIATGTIFCKADLWILRRLQIVIEKVDIEFAKYEYAKALSYIDNFFWKDFCDLYLELSKTRAYGDKEQILPLVKDITDEQIEKASLSASHTIYFILKNILKLYAPFLPHICDELNQIIFSSNQSIHKRGNFAKMEIKMEEIDLEFLINIIENIRKDKSEKQFSIKKEIIELQLDDRYTLPIDLENDLKFICNIQKITYKSEKMIINY